MKIRIIDSWRSSIFYESSRLLDRNDRRKVLLVIVLQISFGFLDLVGVMLIGVVGALAITGVSTGQPGNRVSAFLNFVGLEEYSLQYQVAVIGSIAAILLVFKTLFSIYFARKVLFFLSRRGAAVSTRMIRKLFSQSLLAVQNRSLQTSLYATTHGVTLLTVGVLGVFVSLVADISLLAVLLIGLFVVDTATAFGTLIIFSLVAYILWRLMHQRARELGENTAEISIKNSEAMFEVLTTFREASVRNRKGFYAELLGKQRFKLSDLSAEMTFMPSISKYVVEIVVVVSAVAISAFQFWINDASRAVATLAIFLAATTRIAPAILRLQQSAVSMKGTMAAAQPTLDLMRELGWGEEPVKQWSEPDFVYEGFEPAIRVSNLSFSYPDNQHNVIEDLNFSIASGEFVGIVGSSGAGKTTLVDLILGLLKPKSGEVYISGLNPEDVINQYPGAISYIPQDVIVVNGSIRRNVTLGYEEGSISDERVWEALKIANLDYFVNSLPDKLDSPVGERGTKLSGGQRQRLGIARAMVTKPKLLILDEATSAMDGKLEFNVGEAIQGMRGEVTIIMIAHRLSTIRKCDLILHLAKGRIISSGTFEELKLSDIEFRHQAELMGL